MTCAARGRQKRSLPSCLPARLPAGSVTSGRTDVYNHQASSTKIIFVRNGICQPLTLIILPSCGNLTFTMSFFPCEVRGYTFQRLVSYLYNVCKRRVRIDPMHFQLCHAAAEAHFQEKKREPYTGSPLDSGVRGPNGEDRHSQQLPGNTLASGYHIASYL